MIIFIDPDEMATVAQALERCAVEALDIGTPVIGCHLPGYVRNTVDDLVATGGGLLEEIAINLLRDGVDLVERAVRVRQGVHGATSSPAGVTAAGFDNIGFSPMVLGGHSLYDHITIIDTQGEVHPAGWSPFGNSMILGGVDRGPDFWITDPATGESIASTDIDHARAFGTLPNGQPSALATSLHENSVGAARAARSNPQIATLMGNVDLAMGRVAGGWLEPTKWDFENKFGYIPTSREFESWAWGSAGRPQPINILDGVTNPFG